MTAEDSLNLLRSTMLTVKLDTGFNIEIDFPISPFTDACLLILSMRWSCTFIGNYRVK